MAGYTSVVFNLARKEAASCLMMSKALQCAAWRQASVCFNNLPLSIPSRKGGKRR